MDAPLKVCDVLVESKVEVSHHDNILYMFYGSFYVICILTYLYSLHKYRPLDHNTNYISQGARSVLIFSSLCLYCPVLYQELSKLNEVCNSNSLETQIHVTRRAQKIHIHEEDCCGVKSGRIPGLVVTKCPGIFPLKFAYLCKHHPEY